MSNYTNKITNKNSEIPNFFVNKNSKELGITLIALVITIIVLLILAGVAIATLTGENGVLTQAENAGTQTEISEVIEKAKLDIVAWQTEKEGKGEDYTLTDNIIKSILTGKDYVEGEPGETSFVSTNGHTISYADLYDRIRTITEVKGAESGFDKNTTVVDEYGNIVKVPEGFKIASDSATNVTGGVVIEDATDGATAGSQFVWIPVGKVYTNKEQTTYETIELKRYVFNGDGTINEELSKSGPTEQLKESFTNSYHYIEGLKNSVTGNTHAKDVENFITKVNISKGYYIGRYEARTNTTQPRNSSTDDTGLTQITVKPNEYVYNYVTQPQAANLSKKLYTSENFTSDLVNSYAWDTAIVFIQIFDDRITKTKEYSRQDGVSRTFAEKGTNSTTTQDKVCNIYDMASNCREWTTETYNDLDIPCTARGGSYQSNNYTNSRYSSNDSYSNQIVAFRPILYL